MSYDEPSMEDAINAIGGLATYQQAEEQIALLKEIRDLLKVIQ